MPKIKLPTPPVPKSLQPPPAKPGHNDKGGPLDGIGVGVRVQL